LHIRHLTDHQKSASYIDRSTWLRSDTARIVRHAKGMVASPVAGAAQHAPWKWRSETRGGQIGLAQIASLHSSAHTSSIIADALAALKRNNTPAAAAGALMSYAEFRALVELPRDRAVDEDYG
jgi:hypothetical protein